MNMTSLIFNNLTEKVTNSLHRINMQVKNLTHEKPKETEATALSIWKYKIILQVHVHESALLIDYLVLSQWHTKDLLFIMQMHVLICVCACVWRLKLIGMVDREYLRSQCSTPGSSPASRGNIDHFLPPETLREAILPLKEDVHLVRAWSYLEGCLFSMFKTCKCVSQSMKFFQMPSR